MQAEEVFEGRYRVVRPLGRGAFGDVHLVEDVETGRPWALKVLLPEAAGDETALKRFDREARYGQLLAGPHAVRVERYDTTAGGTPYIVMEYVAGRELPEVLREDGPFPPERAAHIGRQILDALEEAHARGIIHRDLKPENIVLTRPESGDQSEDETAESADVVKVFDFGIAKRAADRAEAEQSERLTAVGGTLGTPEYMSPEQCEGQPLTPASDIYSLGVVLYELLTGRTPFQDTNPVNVMIAHACEPVPPLPEPLANHPVGRAALKALSKRPADRYQSAAEFRAALTERPPEDAEIAPSTAVITEPVREVMPAASASVDETAMSSARPGPGNFFTRHWLTLVIIALLLIAGLGAFLAS